MGGKKLYYGCIYNDISACCRFCIENHIPLVTIFSDCVPCSYKYGEDIRIFGGNANAYHYAQVEMSKLSPNDTVNQVGGLAETGFERNGRPNILVLADNDPRSRGQWTFEKKLTYEWIR